MASPSGIRTGGFRSSPRKRRRLLILGAALLIVGLGAFVALVVLPGTPNAFTDTYSKEPAKLYHPDKKVPLSQEQIRLARQFIQSAVERRNLDAAYDIVNADLKGTLTRKQWDTGDIPVVFYPARNADSAAFVVDYSFQTSALLEVDLVAKRGFDQRPELYFFLGLERDGGKPAGRWLVNYWQAHWHPPIEMALD
jgi:hypothetical protein